MTHTTNDRAKAILDQAISPSSVQIAGRYTVPHTWGVYRIMRNEPIPSKRFRAGNHPVRETELRREFGVVDCVALFTSEHLAKELAHIYNSEP
jgi:hypothetical protein